MAKALASLMALEKYGKASVTVENKTISVVLKISVHYSSDKNMLTISSSSGWRCIILCLVLVTEYN